MQTPLIIRSTFTLTLEIVSTSYEFYKCIIRSRALQKIFFSFFFFQRETLHFTLCYVTVQHRDLFFLFRVIARLECFEFENVFFFSKRDITLRVASEFHYKFLGVVRVFPKILSSTCFATFEQIINFLTTIYTTD